MWRYVNNTNSTKQLNNVVGNMNFYDVEVEDKIHILTTVLSSNYEVYIRDVEDVIEIMVYDRELNNYYDEEQGGYNNIINFWEETVVPRLAKC